MTAIRDVTDQAALTLEVDGDGVAWIVFDRPGSRVNLLTADVFTVLDALLAEVEDGARAGRIRALVVRSGKDGSFFAGADVGEIASVSTEDQGYRASREGQRVFQRVASLPVPTVAAVDGLCLGGGTELILACRARIASDRPETRIGLPEIRLGILPGFGGTTRLPRLVGLTAALPMILTGSNARASKARRIGLVDEIVHPSILYRRAATLALEGKRSAGARRTLVAKVLDGPGAAVALRQARKQVMRETRGHYPAPLAALDVIAQSRGAALERALDIEAHALGRLIVTDVSKNLVRVFHLMEGAKKAGPRDVEPRAVQKAAVLGAGVMGGGIAQLLAQRGCTVRLKDIDAGAIGHGLQHARQLFDRSVKRKRMRKLDAVRAMNAISGTLEYTGFREVDITIEAVVERLDVK
ncbi:MAG: enoyl-CoA hydratase-related protein, partial [Gemmatimonadota bacterium]